MKATEMTNKEKAEELRRYVCNPCMPNGEDALGLLNRTNRWKADLRNIWEVCERAALEMAELKDEQFREYLEKKRNHYDIQKDSTILSNDYEEGVRCDAVVTALDIIINELFKED